MYYMLSLYTFVTFKNVTCENPLKMIFKKLNRIGIYCVNVKRALLPIVKLSQPYRPQTVTQFTFLKYI